MSESTGKHKTYIDTLFGDAKQLQEKADVHKDTKVVNFTPTFTDDFTQEDLNKAVGFINRQGAMVAAATSNTAFDNFSEGKAEHWTGVMDLGGVKIMAESHLREVYDMGQDKKEYDYGITDLTLDFVYPEELTAFYDHFGEIDHERCKKLFEE